MTNDQITNDQLKIDRLVIRSLDIGHFFIDKLSPARIVVIAKFCGAAPATRL